VTLAGVRLEVRGSIGIALAPDHGHDGDELLARADVAMYQAKGRDSAWAVYDPAEDRHTPERLALLTEMRHGLERHGEFFLHYQPKCDARTGDVTGVEALVRWAHPTRGTLPPDEFIPIAETTELMTALTLTVLEQAVRDGREWLDGGRRLAVAVNLSVRHLTDQHLPEQVDAVLRRHGLPPELLTLEVTESTVMNDPIRAAAVLARLRESGVRVAIDDYGTGYSSLAYLKRLAID
jgi:predicted signal transduction protein with EAL and GGDEF domain